MTGPEIAALWAAVALLLRSLLVRAPLSDSVSNDWWTRLVSRRALALPLPPMLDQEGLPAEKKLLLVLERIYPCNDCISFNPSC